MSYRINDNGIDRDMTEQEITIYEEQSLRSAELDAELEAKQVSKKEILKKLGLTQTEISALLS